MNNRSHLWFSVGISVALITLAFLFLGYWGYGPHGFNGFNGMGWPMHRGYYGPGGMMGFGGYGRFGGMGIVPLLFWGGIILAVALIVIGGITYKKGHHSTTEGSSDQAMEILKQRYARGEIDQEQFMLQRDVLKKADE